jgi:hypothetical protein
MVFDKSGPSEKLCTLPPIKEETSPFHTVLPRWSSQSSQQDVIHVLEECTAVLVS